MLPQIHAIEQELLKEGYTPERALPLAIAKFEYVEITQRFSDLHGELVMVRKQLTAMHSENLLAKMEEDEKH